MFAIYKKELRSYFIGPIGYVFAGVFLLIAALICCYTTLLSQSYDTSAFFTVMIFVMAVLVPLLTMKLFSDERKMRTEQLLLTAPVSLTGMVLGKFFAAFTIFAGCMAATCINFLPLYVIAATEEGSGPIGAQIVGGMIGLILIGAAFIAIGTFVSSLTENQLAAAVLTVAVILLMLLCDMVAEYVPVPAIQFVISWFGIMSRYKYFTAGMLDFAAILYYLSISGVFLLLTVRVYDKRRWG